MATSSLGAYDVMDPRSGGITSWPPIGVIRHTDESGDDGQRSRPIRLASLQDPTRDVIFLDADKAARDAKKDSMLSAINAAIADLTMRKARLPIDPDNDAGDTLADINEAISSLQGLADQINTGKLATLPPFSEVMNKIRDAGEKAQKAELAYGVAVGATMSDVTLDMIRNYEAHDIANLSSTNFAHMSRDQLRAVSGTLQRHSDEFVGQHNARMGRLEDIAKQKGIDISGISAFSKEKQAEREAALAEAKKTGNFKKVYGYDIDIAAAGVVASDTVGAEQDAARKALEEAKARYVAESMRLAAEEAKRLGLDEGKTKERTEAARVQASAEANAREQAALRDAQLAQKTKSEQARATATLVTADKDTTIGQVETLKRLETTGVVTTLAGSVVGQPKLTTPVIASDNGFDDEVMDDRPIAPAKQALESRPAKGQAEIIKADGKPLPEKALAEATQAIPKETKIEGGQDVGHEPKTANVQTAAAPETAQKGATKA